MSLAEKTAYQVYEKYNLGSLPLEVKNQVIILMLNNGNKASKIDSLGDSTNDMAPYTIEELRARIKQSEEDIKAGIVYPAEEVESDIESKYPWLCK